MSELSLVTNRRSRALPYLAFSTLDISAQLGILLLA